LTDDYTWHSEYCASRVERLILSHISATSISKIVAREILDPLEVDYPMLVREPSAAISRLVQFLGRERLPNETAMVAVVDPVLHRHKA
jgi:LPS sulfotransferase NodH